MIDWPVIHDDLHGACYAAKAAGLPQWDVSTDPRRPLGKVHQHINVEQYGSSGMVLCGLCNYVSCSCTQGCTPVNTLPHTYCSERVCKKVPEGFAWKMLRFFWNQCCLTVLRQQLHGVLWSQSSFTTMGRLRLSCWFPTLQHDPCSAWCFYRFAFQNVTKCFYNFTEHWHLQQLWDSTSLINIQSQSGPYYVSYVCSDSFHQVAHSTSFPALETVRRLWLQLCHHSMEEVTISNYRYLTYKKTLVINCVFRE